MAAFRRFIPALAVLALFMGIVSTASAQGVGLTCTTTVVPPFLRAEGLTELTGDIVLTCTGGTALPADTAIPTANITVYYGGTTVTSRLFGSLSEAMLLIDEPARDYQRLCPVSACSASTNADGTEFGSTGTAYNVYQGAVAANSVTFFGVPIAAPGTSATPGVVPTRTFRITNVRINATSISAGAGVPGQANAIITVTPAQTASSLSLTQSQVVVGYVQTSLTFSIGAGDASTVPFAIQQCEGYGATTETAAAILKYKENFANAFKIRQKITQPDGTESVGTDGIDDQAIPGLIYNTETGFYDSKPEFGGRGLASNGTRLKAVFNNIPAGVSLYVSSNALGASTATGSLFSAPLTISEYGSFVGVAPTDSSSFGNGSGAIPVAQIPIANGTGTAVWEVTAANPTGVDEFDFGVWFTASPSVGSSATLATTVTPGTVNGSYGGIYTAAVGGVASSSLQIPRFVDTSTAMNILNVNVCRTTILFPFVTNTNGFDTGLAIANTTTDPFGTTPQAGSCSLNFYGSNAPATPVDTGEVASGTAYTTTVLSVAPNFQGYVIAVCDFQKGHGFAFVSDVGARNIAMGYLGLILPDPPRAGGITLTTGSGEVLGQ